MAIETSFKSVVSSGVGTAPATIYTAPPATTITTIGMSCANLLATFVTYSAKLVKAGGGEAFIVKNAPLSPGGAEIITGGDQKIVLNVGDSIVLVASDPSAIDVILSFMEQEEV